MSGQYVGDRLDNPDNIERPDQGISSPEVNSDPFADRVPVDAADIHEVPMGGTLASVGPINEPVEAEVPLLETPIQEIPMGGTVAAVGPMDESLAQDVNVVETPVQEFAPVETAAVFVLMDEAVIYEDPKNETLADYAPFGEKVDETAVSPTIPYQAPEREPLTHETLLDTKPELSAALLNREESEHFRTHWNEIQGKFVDEPRSAVQQADSLVTEVIGQLTQMFAKEHSQLEGQWKQGNDVSTEDLRKALQRYRSFFNRLVV